MRSTALAVMLSSLVLAPAGLATDPPAASGSLAVFVLAGQSNMEGQGVVDLDHPEHYNGGRGTLEYVMAAPGAGDRYDHLRNTDGTWVVRDDVFVRFQTRHGLKAGGLSIGFAGYEGKHHIGPEFQFGHVVGEAIAEPVLLIKTAWGGKSLFKDFRPPSSGGDTGPYYERMLLEIDEALAVMATEFPALAGRRPVIRGFVWQQGWNDMVDATARAEYEDNLVNLILDVRTALKSPDLPVVIGELGNDGENAGPPMRELRAAQVAATSRPEVGDAVRFVKTTAFARPAQESPNTGHGHHWYGNAESYFLIGDALARAMLELLPKK